MPHATEACPTSFEGLKYELYHESEDDSTIAFALDVLERTIGPLRGVLNTITRKSIGSVLERHLGSY
jgi:hypothetical protein